MALVCDIKSDAGQQQDEDDLEDGEIEDDGDDDDVVVENVAAENAAVVAPPTPVVAAPAVLPPKFLPPPPPLNDMKNERAPDRENRNRGGDRDRRRHEEKKTKHMTEAEKSILHLRKRERMQREKWEKFRKDQNIMDVPDDFAITIEKQIASVLKKDKPLSEEEKDDDAMAAKPRGRKRKNRDKDRQKGKQRKTETSPPKQDDIVDDPTVDFITMRGSGVGASPPDQKKDSVSPPRTDESYESEFSSDERPKSAERRERKYKKGKNRKFRERSRERRAQLQLQDAQGVCVFFLQGKCQKNDCPYSHEAVPPMKLELCKFYLMECCAKGEKCSYMHSEFPCKFYHTGLPCPQGDNCKFAHGKPLSEGLRQILFKHIETAPREILGGFPRMSREEALNKINLTQQNLIAKYGPDDRAGIPPMFDMNMPIPPELSGDDCKNKNNDKPVRNRPSRWQDPDPTDGPPCGFGIKPFNYSQDQDMRITSNGDIDMRTLPPLASLMHDPPPEIEQTPSITPNPPKLDVDIRNLSAFGGNETKDVDIRHQTMDPRILATKDVDIRQISSVFDCANKEDRVEDEMRLHIDTEAEEDPGMAAGLPSNLPKMQRDLFLRIQAQQKDNQPEEQRESFDVDDNINWYSDDDDEDENRLTIKVDNEDAKDKEDDAEASNNAMSPPQVKPLDMVKLGDLSKIDISAEVTKLLTSITQNPVILPKLDPPAVIRDPRQAAAPGPSDPRRFRANSTEDSKKISIYEQGCIDKDKEVDDSEADFRTSGRPDVDLRSLQLPFKGMLNYTPAKEIDASINSHPPIPWRVYIVEIPRPDYTGLKLNVQDAEKTGDPRLRKIFRLSVEEKDSPASPKASTVTRIDPRLKKIEESKPQDTGSLSFNQQLNILQSSVFFQSLTSNQKLLLNQELATRNEPNGGHDPVLNSILTNLNLIPNNNLNNPSTGTALTILANVTKLNPMMVNNPNPAVVLGQNPNLMNQMAQNMVQPGLLGAAPGIPNMPPDFNINFDPRNGGLLGNAPPPFVGNFPPDNNFDNYYPQDNNFGGNRGDNRGFNRDRRRGRHHFNNRNNRNFRNRHNRANRSHTPP